MTKRKNIKKIFSIKTYEPGNYTYLWVPYTYILILSGKGQIIKSENSVYEFHAGDLFATFSSETVQFISDVDVLIGSVILNGRKEYHTTFRYYPASTTRLFMQGFMYGLSIQSEEITAKEYILQDICSILYTLIMNMGTKKRTIKNPDVISILENAYNNISNPDYNISEEIRKRNYSQNYMRRLILEETGQTPIQFMTLIRIERSKELLRDKRFSVPIKDIALQCGYKDPLYFSRTFKRLEGISPTEYISRFAVIEKKSIE